MENKPIRSYKNGGVNIAVWEKNGIKTVTFKKSYKDSSDNWKETQVLNHNDIPKLISLLEIEYKKEKVKIETNK